MRARLRSAVGIRASARWLRKNGDRPISVVEAAQIAAMSECSFLRRFKLEMGITPSEYLLRARLDMTCHLLVETDFPVDKIAPRCGIGNGDRLAKIFVGACTASGILSGN